MTNNKFQLSKINLTFQNFPDKIKTLNKKIQ